MAASCLGSCRIARDSYDLRVENKSKEKHLFKEPGAFSRLSVIYPV